MGDANTGHPTAVVNRHPTKNRSIIFVETLGDVGKTFFARASSVRNILQRQLSDTPGISQRAQANARLAIEIENIYRAHDQNYGSPRMTEQLRAEGHRCYRKRVERLMVGSIGSGCPHC
jgi:hypothetical protein